MIVRRVRALVGLEDGITGDKLVAGLGYVKHQENVFSLQVADTLFAFRKFVPPRMEHRMRFFRAGATDNDFTLALWLRQAITGIARNIKDIIVLEKVSLTGQVSGQFT